MGCGASSSKRYSEDKVPLKTNLSSREEVTHRSVQKVGRSESNASRGTPESRHRTRDETPAEHEKNGKRRSTSREEEEKRRTEEKKRRETRHYEKHRKEGESKRSTDAKERQSCERKAEPFNSTSSQSLQQQRYKLEEKIAANETFEELKRFNSRLDVKRFNGCDDGEPVSAKRVLKQSSTGPLGHDDVEEPVSAKRIPKPSFTGPLGRNDVEVPDTPKRISRALQTWPSGPLGSDDIVIPETYVSQKSENDTICTSAPLASDGHVGVPLQYPRAYDVHASRTSFELPKDNREMLSTASQPSAVTEAQSVEGQDSVSKQRKHRLDGEVFPLQGDLLSFPIGDAAHEADQICKHCAQLEKAPPGSSAQIRWKKERQLLIEQEEADKILRKQEEAMKKKEDPFSPVRKRHEEPFSPVRTHESPYQPEEMHDPGPTLLSGARLCACCKRCVRTGLFLTPVEQADEEARDAVWGKSKFFEHADIPQPPKNPFQSWGDQT